jgi:hypothetical protein
MITVRYEAVESVEVGLDEAPPWFTWRVGYNPGFGSRRAGVFWWRGRNWFMDIDDPARALVVHLKKAPATTRSPSASKARKVSPSACPST